MYRNVHVALDGSEHSKEVARLGLELAGGLGAKLTAVHVRAESRLARRVSRLSETLPEGTDVKAPVSPDVVKVRTGWLADQADDADVSFASERVEGQPHQALLGYMAPAEEDLLVLGAWGQSGRSGGPRGSRRSSSRASRSCCGGSCRGCRWRRRGR